MIAEISESVGLPSSFAALGSVFIFRGRSIGLDNYKGKELMSRVVVRLEKF